MNMRLLIHWIERCCGVPRNPAVRVAQSVNQVEQLPMIVLGNGCSALIGYMAMASDFTGWQLTVLPVVIWLLMLPLIFSWVRLRNAPVPKTVSKNRIVQIVLYSALMGIVWACMELYYLPRTQPTTFAFLVSGCAFLAVGAVASLYMVPVACIAYAVPMMLAAIIVTFSWPSPSNISLTLGLLVMLGGQAMFLRNNWRQFYSIHKLSADNDELLRQLATELIAAEKTNDELLTSEKELIASQRVLNHYTLALDTAHSQSEQLRNFISELFEALPNIILVTNRLHSITLTNLHAKEFLKKYGVPEAPAPSISTVLSKLKIANGPEADHFLVSSPGAFENESGDGIEVIGPGGILFLFQRRKFASSFVITLTDITAMRAIEKERDAMLEFLTHDLRAPQSSIISLTSDPYSNENDETAERRLRIQRLARHTLRLTDQLVSLGRAKSISLQKTESDLSELLIGVVDDYWYLAQRAGITLVCEPQGQYWVNIDRELIQRALINVIDNAIRYSPAKSSITCRIFTPKNETSWIILQISNDGPGISDAALADIDSGINRAPSLARDGRRGGGMGLLIVKTVLERHGALLKVTRGHRGGTRVSLLFRSQAPVTFLDPGNK